jgi:signal transduction histidine kinase
VYSDLLPKQAADQLYRIVGLAGSAAIIIGVRVHRPRRAIAWYLLAAGNLMWVAGDVLYQTMSNAGVTPWPSYPDLLYLGAYPLLTAAVVALSGGPRRSVGSLIDAAIIATSAGLVAWVFLMEPYATDTSLTLTERVVSIAYPMGDLLLFSTICWVFLNKRKKGGSASLKWLLLSVAALLTSDVVYGIQVLEGTYAGGWTDAGYIISYLAFGAAALDPSMRTLGPRKTEAGSPTTSWRRLALLATATILGPGLLGVTAVRGTEVSLWLMTIGTLVLFLFTFMRIAGLMRSVERNAALLEAQGADLKTAVEELKGLEVVRSHLMEAVHHASEKERSSLALDLHDGPIQHLTTLSYEVDLARLSLDTGDRTLIDDALEVVEHDLSAEIESLRALMTDLRPPALDERGLAQALSDLVAGFRTRTRIECRLDVAIPDRLPPQVETVLYRIAQEALGNVAKHSAATNATVTCFSGDEIEMTISDDGIGFDPSSTDMSGMDGHLGLASIKERVGFADGTSSIVSRVGKGTRVSVTLTIGRNRDAEVTRIAG